MVINNYNYKLILKKIFKCCNIILQIAIGRYDIMLTSEMIGERIKKLREQKKISQQSMVNELKRLSINMSRETLSKIENGNRTVSAVELKGISSVLSIDVEDILKDDEDNGLVTLFRNRNMKEETIEKVEYLQDMIISFINQKKIAQSDAKKNVTPLWRD